MPRIDISRLPDESRIWIFGISPSLDERNGSRLLAVVDRFLDDWSAHNQPIVSARDLRHGSFLVIAVDQRSETSGCSIDRMFGLLRGLESELGVAILDPNRIFYRSESGRVAAMTRREFVENGRPDTVVFDTLAERIGKIRSGLWEKPARDSWHQALF
ncbi:MAG TPA: hypothetical protein VER58_09340 [Thermoanaerobaculia bacterium]|nr:hypothetical protein [Thermoanaerobaculia bacterium]